MSFGEFLDIVAARINQDKRAQANYSDEQASRIAHITLDSLAANIASEMVGRDKAMKTIADRFLEACGPKYQRAAILRGKS
jgi:hypothetical protein